MRRLTAVAVALVGALGLGGCGGVDRPEEVAWLPQPRDFSADIADCEELVFAREVSAALSLLRATYSECWVASDGWRFLTDDATRLVEAIEAGSGGVVVGEPLGGAQQRAYCRPTLLAEDPRRVDGYIAGFLCTATIHYRGDEFAPLSVSLSAWVLLNDTQFARLREVAAELDDGLDAPQRISEGTVEVLRDAPVELAVFVRERQQ